MIDDRSASGPSRRGGIGTGWRVVAVVALVLLFPLGWLAANWLDVFSDGDNENVSLSIPAEGDQPSTSGAGLTHQPQLAAPDRVEQLLGGRKAEEVRALDLADREVVDADLAWLANLWELTELDVRGGAITDAGLVHLRRATHLKRVDLRHTAVTVEGVQQLKRALPDLEVLHDLIARQAAEAFRRRYERHGLPPVGDVSKRPEATVETAIEAGLEFFVARQQTDGRWTLSGSESADDPINLQADTAATGLVLLSFLGAGYDHNNGKHADTVRRGLEFLLNSQQENGDLYAPEHEGGSADVVWLYSHGIASIALCEAYGMTRDEALRLPAQRALNFIVASQHPEYGGWRYSPQISSDTSVTGWLVMALKSGQLAGLEVPDQTMDNARKWLDAAQASPETPHLYVYNPHAPDTPQQRHGRNPNPTMASVGLLLRLYDGWSRGDERMMRGAEYLRERLPAMGDGQNDMRDAYYWYYGTQVMFHMGGEHWRAWNTALQPLLTESQIREGQFTGSWDPRSPVPDRWAGHAGRVYVTALNLLSLEVYYRHLPLYLHTAE